MLTTTASLARSRMGNTRGTTRSVQTSKVCDEPSDQALGTSAKKDSSSELCSLFGCENQRTFYCNTCAKDLCSPCVLRLAKCYNLTCCATFEECYIGFDCPFCREHTIVCEFDELGPGRDCAMKRIMNDCGKRHYSFAAECSLSNCCESPPNVRLKHKACRNGCFNCNDSMICAYIK